MAAATVCNVHCSQAIYVCKCYVYFVCRSTNIVSLAHPGCFHDSHDNIYIDASNLLLADVLDHHVPVKTIRDWKPFTTDNKEQSQRDGQTRQAF